MRTINILGMKLQDYSIKESLSMAEEFLKEGAVHTVLFLTGDVLLEAGKKEEQREWIEKADLTVWGDMESLEAAKIMVGNRSGEADDKEFLQEFLQRLARNHLALLAMADTKEHAEDLKSELLQLQDGVTVVGAFPLAAAEDSRESTINEINLVAPAVVIARMPYGAQLRWLEGSKALLNTGVWIALPEQFSCIGKKKRPVTRIANYIRNTFLRWQVDKYTE